MKKLSKLVALATSLVAVTAFTIIGCSNFSSSDDDNAATVTTGATTRKSSANSIALEIGVTADSDLVNFSETSDGSARTITPEALVASKVKFYLGGTDLVTGKPIDVIPVEFVATSTPAGTAGKEGTVTINLEPSNYRFTLVALPKMKNGAVDATGTTAFDDDATAFTSLASYVGSAVLIGYANADLRYSDESANIKFKMTSDGLTGKGTVNFKFYLKDWTDASKAQTIGGGGTDNDTLVIADAKIGLYNIRTGAAIDGSESSNLTFVGKYAEDDALSYTGNTADLKAGTYDLKVTFRMYVNGVEKQYVFGDSIMILPSQVTSATFGIPDILDLKPADLKSFTVGYITPETGAYNDNDYYKILFNWEEDDTKPGSKVEQYFEIQLYDITNVSTITPNTFGTAGENTPNLTAAPAYNPWESSDGDASPAPAAASANTQRYKTEFYGLTEDNRPSWYCGSLQKDNTFAGFYVELGKRYLARIRAVNEVGVSGWKYAVSKSANTGTTPVAPTAKIAAGEVTREESSITAVKTLESNFFNTDIINLFRLKYETNGGSFTGNIEQTYYFDQLKEGTPIMIPNGTDTVSLETGVVNSQKTDATAGTKAPYNGGTAITLKKGNQEWANWKVYSATGATYPDKFEVQTGAKQDGTVYYTTGTALPTPDVNGSTVNYIVASNVPATLTADTYYLDSGKPTNYLGFKNLTLYANYTKTTFTVTLANKADYLLEKNVKLKMTGTGTGETSLQPVYGASGVVEAYDMITVNRTIIDTTDATKKYNVTTLTFEYTYEADAFGKYDKVTLVFDRQGNGNKSTKDMAISTTGGTASVDISSLEKGSYTVKLVAYVASTANAAFELPFYLKLND